MLTNDFQAWESGAFKEVFNAQVPELLPRQISEDDDFERIYRELDIRLRNLGVSLRNIDFNLEKDARRWVTEASPYTDSEKRKIMSVISSKVKRSHEIEKMESVKKYLEKKRRRKYVCQIKYKIRQDLACKRLRVKGKFIKSSKMDLMAVANLLLTRELIRREGRAGQ